MSYGSDHYGIRWVMNYGRTEIDNVTGAQHSLKEVDPKDWGSAFRTALASEREWLDPIMAMDADITNDQLEDAASALTRACKQPQGRAYDAQIPEISVTELGNILAVARLAHKYGMASWQSWALGVILQLLTKNNTSLSSAQYCAIYDLSYMLSADSVRDKTTAMWLNMIHRGTLPISDALAAAESKGARPFLTLLYAHQVGCISRFQSATLQPLTFDFDGIPPIHIQRLLLGYWSLTESWTQFRLAMIPLPCPVTCFLERHKGLCLPAFKSIWERAVGEAERLPITATANRVQRLISSLRSHTPSISVTRDIPWGGAPCV
ncbi:hypothetical protein B0H14DRAFT_3462397 [Mycena olivaceomarginata]|nr:hypothetical protein B0H14DRAFT_3462397 [Mycena olivaceomarginata]